MTTTNKIDSFIRPVALSYDLARLIKENQEGIHKILTDYPRPNNPSVLSKFDLPPACQSIINGFLSEYPNVKSISNIICLSN